jgi:PAS domain S-box-containing protein
VPLACGGVVVASVADPDCEIGFELFEILPDAVIVVDQQGVIRYANRQAGRLFGLEPATLVSAPVETLVPEHLRERHIAHRAKYDFKSRIRPMGTGIDLVARRADGTTFPVDIMLSPLKHLARPMALAVVRDMTELRAIEAQKQKLLMHDRLQIALDAAQLGWWHYDPFSRVVSGDTRFKEIFDVADDEMTIEEIDERLHSDDVARFRANREAALDPNDPKPYAIEYRIQRRDGEVRWVQAHGLAYFEGSGRERRAVGAVGTVADITERKEREEKLHLLMREVTHRARNMLSVVDAISHQTVASDPEDYVGRFSDRIRALAAYQDLLVESEWHGVEIGDLARAQLAPFADLIGARIMVCGPKLRLNAASAQAVGLALHELTTNAGKYGALSKDTGQLEIGWWTEGETFTMSWAERDGPQVPLPRRRGFGSVVMQEMAERSVNGKVDLQYAPSGVTWRLTCPAANVLEHWQCAEIA